MSEQQTNKPNGTLNRILQFGQLVVLGAVLPWGVWVTGQIYGLNSAVAQHEQWRLSRERAAVATLTDVEIVRRDVEIAKAKVKDELMQALSVKLDTILLKVNDLDVKLTRHEAATKP